MLLDMVMPENIRIHADANTWEEAIRQAGALLLDTGYIEQSYIDKMVEMIKEIGPYIVIGPSIALAHARPTDGVHRVGVSFLTLANPVAFGDEDNDPVRVVICLCATDNKSHLGLIGELARVLNEDDSIDRMCACTNAAELIEYLQSF